MPKGLHGWRKDPPKDKDWSAHRLLMAAPPPPESASLRDRAGEVLDQVRNDCVANAVAKAIQVALTKPNAQPEPLPSRNWIYYMAGCLEGSQKLDNGRYIRDALDSLATVGWPDESGWPYDGRWNVHPGAMIHWLAYDSAKTLKPSYYRIDAGPERATLMKQAIAAGHPIVVGSDVSQAWEDQDGITPLPYDPAAPVLGGHAYCILEYDAGGIHQLNSWNGWAQQGWGYLGWSWTEGFQDVWVIAI
jgi:hypothetical protein